MADLLDELMDYLVAEAVIPDGSIFAEERPDEPDRLIVLYATGGQEPRRTLGGGLPVSHRPRVQVVARDRTGPNAMALAWSAWKVLEQVLDQDIGGTRYVAVEVLQDPFPHGRDDRDRVRYAFNIQIERDVNP